MLAPFSAHLWSGTDAAQHRTLAARAREVRDAAGPYQRPTAGPTVLDGFREHRDCLVRYEVFGPATRIVSGLVGLTRLADLRPHEATFLGPVEKRTPIVTVRPLLALSEHSLPDLEPIGPSVTARAGVVRHVVTPVAPRGPVEVGRLTIADGHHRTRAGLAAGVEMEMTLVIGDGGKGLSSKAFHRRMSDVGPLPRLARERFRVTAIPRPLPRAGGLVWVSGGGRPRLLKAEGAALAELPDPLRAIPAAHADRLLDPLLDWSPDSASFRVTPAAAVHDLKRRDAALLFPGTPIAAVVRAATAGLLLPAKATRFTPKPVRGLVLHVH